MKHPCVICGRPVPGYVPERCCSGEDCMCQGLPIEPALCGMECGEALYHGDDEDRESLRQRASWEATNG